MLPTMTLNRDHGPLPQHGSLSVGGSHAADRDPESRPWVAPTAGLPPTVI